MHTDYTSDREYRRMEDVVSCRSWDDRVALTRKAIQEGISLSQIEQGFDWLDSLSETRAADRAASEQARQGSRLRPVPVHHPTRQRAAIRAVEEADHQAEWPTDGPQRGDDPVHAQTLRRGAS
jgi:hypothetical protein